MATLQTSIQDRRPSPALALNLASNNPFRRAVSPQPPSYNSLSPHTPSELDERRASTNPFLDTYKSKSPPSKPTPARPAQPVRQYSAGAPSTAPLDQKGPVSATANVFADLSLEKKISHPDRMTTRPVRIQAADSQKDTGSYSRRTPHAPQDSTHGHSLSQEEKTRQTTNFDPFQPIASPPRLKSRPPQDENRRPRTHARRNSESSMMDFKDEDRRRRERRPGDSRDRPERREGKSTKDASGRSKPSGKVRPARGLDLIDKLDITGLYGPGMIHHDGPFDACNPHRNKKTGRHAPMEAFPEGSANMKLGGGVPKPKHMDYDMYHGRSHQGFNDYNETAPIRPGTLPPRPGRTEPDTRTGVVKPDQASWDAKDKVEQLHGDESAGLGTSTFFEGTAVSRSAYNRRESENDDMPSSNGGLQRKRSIAQKIRGMSRPRGGWGDHNGTAVRSPEPFPESPSNGGPQSAGGRVHMNDTANPYFADATTDKKAGTHVTIAPTSKPSAGPSTSANGAPQTRPRTGTNGSATSPQAEPRESDEWGLGERQQVQPQNKEKSGSGTGAGLLGRVKSLRGRKTRPERGPAT